MVKKKPTKQTLIRSVRFGDYSHIEAIEKKAKSLEMSVSTYLRVCALAGAGVSNEAVLQTAELVKEIEGAVG
ncbi:MAG: hypothetical protein HC882_06275 [Acidobacteria bacterium]|nr:hypothetical protein [Acidobacteriota bacterium]